MENTKRILITGGSGAIGTSLTQLLLQKGYEVAHLGRSVKQSQIKTFLWNPDRNEIDPRAIEGVDVIIHLAGAGIADKRWSEKHKEEILKSRTHSARLLTDLLKAQRNRVSTFISASGINYYGLGTAPPGGFRENDLPGDDFMARVSSAWESEVDRINDPAIRRVIIRTGVVLTKKGGALETLAMPVRFYVGAPLGSGSQMFNWIHIDDLCRIYLKAIEDPDMRGVYNGVAPHPVSNRELTRELSRVLKRPLWMPGIPAFAVRLVAGEVAEVVLKGDRISSRKIEDTGFQFQYTNIDAALRDLL